MKQSLFISFEGIDGCGKSTQIERLREKLTRLNYETVFPREPGGTAIGERLRAILLDRKNSGMTARAELLMFLASRAQNCREVIAPALAAGKIVICDRFMDSSVAYQGYGRDLGGEAVKQLNRFAVEEVVPDLTVLLDLPVELARARMNGRGGGEGDRLDRESGKFMQKTRDGFLRIAREEAERVRIVDASGTIEEVQAQIWDLVRRVLP